jgi:hypothetical protein
MFHYLHKVFLGNHIEKNKMVGSETHVMDENYILIYSQKA